MFAQPALAGFESIERNAVRVEYRPADRPGVVLDMGIYEGAAADAQRRLCAIERGDWRCIELH